MNQLNLLQDGEPNGSEPAIAADPRGHALRRRPDWLINEAAACRYALEYAATKKRFANGDRRFSRVAKDARFQWNEMVKRGIRAFVDRQPSAGRTIA